MENSLEKTMLKTKHFIANVYIKNRTWQLIGEFPHEVRTIPDNPWGSELLREEIQELRDLDDTIRNMIGIKTPVVEVKDGIHMHSVPEE